MHPRVTGFFGTVTRDSVARFQTESGIDPIGEVGLKKVIAGFTNSMPFPVTARGRRPAQRSPISRTVPVTTSKSRH
jgi:hypothetical protein